MSRRPKGHPRCLGSPAFDPDEVIGDASRLRQAQDHLADNAFSRASRVLLSLPEKDAYAYRAMASVRLDEAQHAVNLGAINGLHAWYRDEHGASRDHPPLPDIEAYISIFDPASSTPAALKNFATNARRGSIRSEAAEHLAHKRYLHPAVAARLAVPKCKSPPSLNPSFVFWAWSCRALEWCGPCTSSERVATSHHVLPVLMHHFGCATPSHESLEILRRLADGRSIIDVGSGNGYWTLLLRRYGLTVHPIDNMQSEWRVTWVGDTVISDGVKWLRGHEHGKDMVLLLVYPVVAASGSFTRQLVTAYQGDTLAVVGTQNTNGYTGFEAMTMDQFMARWHGEWTRVVQIPLPSFAGKDEAMYVFQRGARAPKESNGA